MRALAALILALLASLSAAGGAAADHHQMRVNELQLSSGGDTAKQFVELLDSTDEPFPAFREPYRLSVFDGAGTEVAGSPQDLGNPFPHLTQPYLIASSGSGLIGDAALAIQLPQGAGEVCFTAGSAPIERVHCMAYGCPAAVHSSTGGSQAGPAPADGSSLQRAGGSLFLGAPTPKAANTAATPANCPGGNPTGPGGGGAGGADKVKPKVKASAKKTQGVDKLSVSVTLSERAKLTVSGTVAVPGSSRTLRFKTVRRTLAAGTKKRVRLKLSHARLKQVKRALKNGHKLKAKLKLQAKDAAGNKSLSKRLSIKLKS